MSDMNPLTEKVRVVRWRMANEKLRFSEEMRIIPGWAYALSFVLLIAIEILVPIMRRHDAHPVPFLAFVPIMTFVGLLVAALGLLIGYVNRDAKRRGMNAALWTILVCVIPNAIGFIIYFLAREPMVFKCPQCSETVSARFNFCPKCKFNLNPTCPECKHAVRPGDRYCPFCAHDLLGENSASAAPFTPVTPGAGV
ncbi:MAG TPA: zinc ribbon domain-containing protein [Terriglobia bacterium]|nr:zinc ribbon domain-containing protein [Terriglobia bacterium]